MGVICTPVPSQFELLLHTLSLLYQGSLWYGQITPEIFIKDKPELTYDDVQMGATNVRDNTELILL